MGHLDHDDDGAASEPTFTVKLYWPHTSAPDLFRGCTNIDREDSIITFTDSSDKEHICSGVTYEVLEE